MNGRGVVVSGLGVISPHGNDAGQMFERLMLGQSAVHVLSLPQIEPMAAATCTFDAEPWFSRLQLAGVDRVSQFAVAAAELARADAGWSGQYDGERIGIFVGSSMGGATAFDDGYAAHAAGKRPSPLAVVASMANAPAAHIAMRVGAFGPVYTYSLACASSAAAIAEAAKAIQIGEIDVAIAGGCEAMLVPGIVRAWQSMRILAQPDETDVATSCRPFAQHRKGLVLGEGAAMLVLESEEHARLRGVDCYAHWAGSGTSCDAKHLSKPDAQGQARALRQALARGGLTAAQVGYCNAHGTATQVGDVVECQALRAVWGDDLARLRVSSTKSMHGHLLGAAGALEAVITVLALERKQIPPTANSQPADIACDAPIVRDEGIEAKQLEAAISSSFAFGGSNVVLAFRSPFAC